MQEFRPAAEVAAEATRGAIALVDGDALAVLVLVRRKEPLGGKYKTTGHGSLVITNYDDDILYVSDPVTETAMTRESSQTPHPRKSLKAAGRVFATRSS
jgi:hypothetical protein